MFKNLLHLKSILGKRNSRKVLFLAPFFLISAMLETVSIGLIVPLVSTLIDDTLIRNFLSNFEKDAYSDLDNFQDGKAHKRIGWALSEIQKNINTQSNRIKITNFEEGLTKGINSI